MIEDMATINAELTEDEIDGLDKLADEAGSYGYQLGATLAAAVSAAQTFGEAFQKFNERTVVLAFEAGRRFERGVVDAVDLGDGCILCDPEDEAASD